jgi:hypothetical protein
MDEGNENLVYTSSWDFKISFTYRKILRQGTFRVYFPSERKVCCGFLSPLKFHRIGRVRTRNLWVQWQAHQPLHHQGDSMECNGTALTLYISGNWRKHWSTMAQYISYLQTSRNPITRYVDHCVLQPTQFCKVIEIVSESNTCRM